jgi:hypothetical protein
VVTRTVFLAAGLLCCASTLFAQSAWTMRSDNPTIEVEYLHPMLKENPYLSSADVVTFSTRVKSGRLTAFIFELPWVSGTATQNYVSSIFPGQATSGSTIGNPYIGVEFGSNDTYFFGEFGIRIPLMPNEYAPASAGLTADFDRFEAYTPNVIQVAAALNLNPPLGAGFSCRLRCGPSLDFSSKTGGGSEDLINYAAILSYETQSVEAGAGILGRASITGSSTNRSLAQIEGLLRLHIDHIHPAFQLRTPLDNGLRTFYNLEFGANLAFGF